MRAWARARAHPHSSTYSRQSLFDMEFEVDLHFHVAKLAEIVVVAMRHRGPSEKNIARGLQHALAHHDALSLIFIPALAGVRVRAPSGGPP